LVGVPPGHQRRATEAAHVVGDDFELLRQGGDLRIPHAERGEVAVDQHDRWPRAALFDVQRIARPDRDGSREGLRISFMRQTYRGSCECRGPVHSQRGSARAMEDRSRTRDSAKRGGVCC